MEIYRYPLICWSAGELTCAQVVGTALSLAHPRPERLRVQAAEQLLRDYGDDDDWPPPLAEATLIQVPVVVRPGYHHQRRRFPTGQRLEVLVNAVHGATPHGYRACHLPFLDESFYFDDPEQLTALVAHAAQDQWRHATPEDLLATLIAPRPWLDEVVVRVRPKAVDRARRHKPHHPTLTRLADRFPGPRRRVGLAPDVAWERDAVVGQVVEALLDDGTSALVVGPPGSGKSAVLNEALRRVHQQTRNEPHGPCYGWRTTPHRLLAGTRYLGEWQAQLDELLIELKLSRQILWVTDLVLLVEVGGAGPEDSLAAFILPSLLRGELQLVGEVTAFQLDALRRRLPSLLAPWRLIAMPPLEESQLQGIGELFGDYVARNQGIALEAAARQRALRLCRRYRRQRALPGAWLDLLGACVAEVQALGAVPGDNAPAPAVNEALVLQVFRRQTGLAELLLKDELTLDLEALEAWFAQRLMGQPRAVAALCRVVAVYKAGLNNPDKPVATLLFAGPTGVGKTQAARLVAEYFYGQGQTLDPLVRLDMSEFQHPAQIDRLIGQGRHPGRLIQALRERPFAVLLLDEIEKAHPAFFDTLLNVLDEGQLVDDVGEPTDFRNALVIMTSNVGAGEGAGIGFGRGAPTVDFDAAVRRFFRPEFYNRLDQVVSFGPLSPEACRRIVVSELAALNGREGLSQRGITLQFGEALIHQLLVRGFDKALGARPLQRAIDREIIPHLAAWLLDHPPDKGAAHWYLDWGEGKLVRRT
ncbi:MAG: AAA family ATPase [Candidatus Competibacterales bacterium]